MNALYAALVGAILGAIGGAIGWGITALVWADREPVQRPRWLSVIAVVLMISLTRPIVHWWTTPSVDDQLIRAERQFPALAALKMSDPAEYSEVRAAAQEAQNGNITETDAMERVHAALMRAYQRKLPTAPDELVQAQARLVSAEYSALESSPDICVSYITGTAVVDLRKYLPSNLVASDQDIIARVLQSRATDPVKIASEAEVRAAAEPMIMRIAHDEAISASQVASALQMKGDQELICRVYAALFQHVSELPTQRSAAVTRGLMRMSESSPPS